MELSEARNRIFGAITHEALADLARRMIAIPSPNFEEGEVADFLANHMQDLGLEVEMMAVDHPTDPSKKTRQPIGRLRGSGGGKSLMLNGHTDVNVMMPGWTVDPVKGKYENGWIWGLGAQDDKGGLAAALVGIEALIKSGVRLSGDVLMCPVATHKLGGTGTRTLLAKGVRADYCVNIEHSANTIGSVMVSYTTFFRASAPYGPLGSRRRFDRTSSPESRSRTLRLYPAWARLASAPVFPEPESPIKSILVWLLLVCAANAGMVHVS